MDREKLRSLLRRLQEVTCAEMGNKLMNEDKLKSWYSAASLFGIYSRGFRSNMSCNNNN